MRFNTYLTYKTGDVMDTNEIREKIRQLPKTMVPTGDVYPNQWQIDIEELTDLIIELENK